MLALNLLLALTWMALTGRASEANFFFGFVIGYVLLWIGRSRTSPTRYFTKVPAALSFAGYFFLQLLLANIRVFINVLSPVSRLRPSIVAIPLDLETDAAITLLANVITLTPGTLTLDVSDDRSVLYVHAIHVDDPEAFRAETKSGFERRIKQLLES